MRSKEKRGFTLVETLVAITVLLAAIAGPLTLVSRTLVNAELAKDRLTATYLAQGGIELVRYRRGIAFMRDHANQFNWASACYSDPDGCTINPWGGGVQPCDGACPLLNERTASDHLIYYDVWAPTDPVSKFRRTIKIVRTPGQETEEGIVTSTVEWDFRDRTQSVSMTEIMRKWD